MRAGIPLFVILSGVKCRLLRNRIQKAGGTEPKDLSETATTIPYFPAASFTISTACLAHLTRSSIT